MKGAVLLALVLGATWTIDRLALAAERRGWIYWRRRSPSRSTAGNALQSLHAIFEPERAHIVEEERRISTDESGDEEPPDWPALR